MRALLLTPLCLLLVLPIAHGAEPEKKPAAKPAEPAAAAPIDKAKLIEEFEKSISEATLVGYFTTTGKEDAGMKAERYLLGKVKKLRGDNDRWVFNYQYGDEGPNIPLTLDIKWAGDTPVITLTDMEIPNVGKFSARVLFYRGEYAGTWSAGDHGGHLFGKVEPAEPKAP